MGEILRNLDALPGAFDGLRMFSKEITTDGTIRTYTVETGCQFIFFAVGFSWVTASGATDVVINSVITDSTLFVGTKAVTFTIPASSTLHFLIIGSVERSSTLAIAANTTETLFNEGR